MKRSILPASSRVREVYLGADHAATALKESLKTALQRAGYVVHDVSPSAPLRGDDYPDYAFAVARSVARRVARAMGILACDTGIGMAIAANKVPGIRAALAVDVFSARRARTHNNANILVLGSEQTRVADALKMAALFLRTPFSGASRHARRLRKIEASERKKA